MFRETTLWGSSSGMATERSPSLCNIRSNRGAGGSLPGLSPQFPDLKIAAAIRGEVDDVTGEESARRDTPLRTPPGRRTLLTIQWAEIFGSPKNTLSPPNFLGNLVDEFLPP